jgi:hypothetical protein
MNIDIASRGVYLSFMEGCGVAGGEKSSKWWRKSLE